MATPEDIAARIADGVESVERASKRVLIALAGPPAAGKSTVSSALRNELEARGHSTGLVAMDGFHLGNDILDRRSLRHRKGSPETFDLAGFRALIERLQIEDEVFAPTFERHLDAALAATAEIAPETTHVIVEGNYVLLDEPGWRELARSWSYAVRLSLPLAELEARLVQRWLKYGFSPDAAREKALGNDIPNARRVEAHRLPANLTVEA